MNPLKKQHPLMKYAYISVDVESSGPVPGLYNLLSIGACVVGEREQQFYRELKPINEAYVLDAIRVGSLGLRCLEPLKEDPVYDPRQEQFSPSHVLSVLSTEGVDPVEAMHDFKSWTLEVANKKKPMLVTDIQPFDGSFINWYFARFLPDEQNPFGYKGLNLDVLYRGLCGKINARLKNLGVKDSRQTPHNALDDAVFQAELAEAIFGQMNTI